MTTTAATKTTTTRKPTTRKPSAAPTPAPEVTTPPTPTVKRFVVCEGSKQDWFANHDDGGVTYDCPECKQTSRELRVNLKVTNGKPVPPKVPSHKVEKDVPVTAKGTSQAASKKADAKRALARVIVDGLAANVNAALNEKSNPELAALLSELGSPDEVRQIVANWCHHLPTGDEKGARYWPASFPRPQRSEWI